MKISVIFEDDDLLIVDKPAGITVNNSETTKSQDTVQDWAEEKFRSKDDQPLAERIDKESDFYKRAGIVHRLDKETSGILIIAKNITAFENLQKQFKERVVGKTYLALAHRKITPETGEIDVPVGRLPWSRKQFGIFPGGKESKTFYKVLKYLMNPKTKEILTLVELNPKSGRTHQIRVHLKYINHPIFADFLYAGRKTSRQDRKELARVFLHAEKISFIHPQKKKEVKFESPIPSDLSDFLAKLDILDSNA